MVVMHHAGKVLTINMKVQLLGFEEIKLSRTEIQISANYFSLTDQVARCNISYLFPGHLSLYGWSFVYPRLLFKVAY